jgi:hypothetical protein
MRNLRLVEETAASDQHALAVNTVPTTPRAVTAAKSTISGTAIPRSRAPMTIA